MEVPNDTLSLLIKLEETLGSLSTQWGVFSSLAFPIFGFADFNTMEVVRIGVACVFVFHHLCSLL